MPEKEEARENSQASHSKWEETRPREPTRPGTSISHPNPVLPAVTYGSFQSTLSRQPKGSLSTYVKSYPLSVQNLVMAPILPRVQILTGSHIPRADVLWQAVPVQRP